MKQAALLVLTALLLAACGGNPQVAALLGRADSLLASRPDSALHLLNNMADVMATASQADRMHFELLRLQAADKAYIPHTSDTMTLQLVDYYEHHGPANLLATSYYIAGRVYSDLKEQPQALIYFQKALDLLEGSTDYHLLAIDNSQIAQLLVYQYSFDEAFYYFQQALYYDSLAFDDEGVVYDLRDIADVYLCKENYTLAEKYLLAAYHKSQTTNNQPMVHDIEAQLARLYREMKQYGKAKAYIKEAMTDIQPQNQSSVYIIAACIAQETSDSATAVRYYHQLLKTGSVYAKEEAHFKLAHAAFGQKDYQIGLAHIDSFVVYNDSVRNITNTEAIARINALYNTSKKEREISRLKEERRNSREAVAIISLLTIFIAGWFSNYRHKVNLQRKKQQQNWEAYQIMQRNSMKGAADFIRYQESELAYLRNQIEKADQQKEQSLRELEQRMQEQAKNEVMVALGRKELGELTIKNSDIATLLHHRLESPNQHMKDEEWELVERAVISAYPTFRNALLSYCPQIKQTEYRVSLLLKLQYLKNKDIAKLMSKTPQDISSIRSRLYAKVMGKPGVATDWDAFILSM